MASGTTETEIKLRIENPREMEARLRALGFQVAKDRVFEANTVFDDADGGLRSKGRLLRLREVADRALVTFKGPAQNSKHKTREELETAIGDPGIARLIFERLGLKPTFRYEKYRTEYKRPDDEHGIVTLDETPIGWFVELEGPPNWIDETAADLGFAENSYLTESYGALYLAHCKDMNTRPANMVFATSL